MLASYATWMALLAVAYFTVPGAESTAWGLLGLSSVLAIVTGMVINRPARRLPWLLLAGANACFITGQLSFAVLTQTMRVNVPFYTFADLLYLSTYPLYAAGIYIFIRWRTGGGDRRSLIDALTLTAGLAMLTWIYLIIPYANSPSLSWLQKCFAMAYPLGDLLVLSMLARLLGQGSNRVWSVQLLTIGTTGMLVSDVSYSLKIGRAHV